MKAYAIKMKALILAAAIVTITLCGAVASADSALQAMATKRHSPLCNVERDDNRVALTFDLDGEADAESIIESLSGERAVFFVSEEYFENNIDFLRHALELGYEIQLLEPELKGESKNEIYDRLADRIERMAFVLGVNCSKVRFYLSLYDNNSIRAVYDIGLIPVQWSADDTSEFFRSGDIIRVENDADITGLVERIKSNGFEIVTFDELILKKNYKIDINGTQISD